MLWICLILFRKVKPSVPGKSISIMIKSTGRVRNNRWLCDNHPFSGQFAIHCFLQQNFNRHSDDRMSIHNDHRRWFHSYQSHWIGQFSVRAGNCTLIHENTGFLDSDAQRCTFVCRYSEINQKIRRGRSLVQQPDQKPLTQQGLTV